MVDIVLWILAIICFVVAAFGTHKAQPSLIMFGWIGLALGALGAFALTRVIAGLLFGVTATDAPTFAAMAAVIGIVGFLACYVPARRAARVDPLTALRRS